jgi:tRNA 2-thiouridine synthesizing protein A
MDMASTPSLPDATHRLNVLGFHCPVPVAKTRESLEQLEPGAVLQVLADDPETLHDMPLLLGRGPHRLLSIAEQDGEFSFLIEVVA